MPKRTQSHITADIAVTRVVSIFTGLGWACDTVEHDYGEDVFVQAAANGRVDPFRLWVQVKGTQDAETLRNKRGDFVWRVSHDHVLRWVRSLETVVVVLWDMKSDRGFWMKPHEDFSEWDCYATQRKSASLVFCEDRLFDAASANAMMWRARVTHYALLVRQASSLEVEVLRQREKDPHAFPNYRSRVPTLALDFLELIGFVDDSGVPSDLRQKLNGMTTGFARENPGAAPKKCQLRSLLLAILALANKRCPDLAVPENLLCEGVKAAAVAIGVTEAFERGDLRELRL